MEVGEMKKSLSAFALVAAACAASIGVFAAPIGAHTSTLSYDCFNVTAHLTNFASNGTGVNTAVVTVDGTPHNFSFTTSTFTANVPFVSHSGDPDVVASVSWHGFDGNVGNESATFSADSCAAPPTTTPPTVPVNVLPEVVTRAAAPAVAPAAVVAAPAFTG
jgi:hypothetical protein